MSEPINRDDLWVRDAVKQNGEWVIVDHPCAPVEFDAIARKDGWVKLDVQEEAVEVAREYLFGDPRRLTDTDRLWAIIEVAQTALDALDAEGGQS